MQLPGPRAPDLSGRDLKPGTARGLFAAYDRNGF